MYAMDMLALQSRYNQWMNLHLYAVCAEMSDAERRRVLGAFFRSIHGTLNHLLLVDRLWLGRILGEPFAIAALDQELYGDFRDLSNARKTTDADILELVGGLAESRLSEPLTYISFVKRESVTLPLGLVLMHLFHHQTHHRGQLTTLISQLGYDFGDTDMIYMPAAAAGCFASPNA